MINFDSFRTVVVFADEKMGYILNLDFDGLRKLLKQNNMPFPEDDLAFKVGVHKVRFNSVLATPEEKEESKNFLRSNGFSTQIMAPL